jgi:hypothetical protein
MEAGYVNGLIAQLSAELVLYLAVLALLGYIAYNLLIVEKHYHYFNLTLFYLAAMLLGALRITAFSF